MSSVLEYNNLMNFVEWLLNQCISLLFALWPQTKPQVEKLRSCRLVAHRGVHEDGLAQENSIRAFELCVKNQIWAAEFDVRFTADDEPIISHDPGAGRLWQRPDLTFADLTFEQVRRQLPQILHLRELIEKFGLKNGQGLHLMIEIKENHAESPRRVEKLKTLLSDLTPVRDYHLLALDPKILEPLSFCPKEAFLDVIWLDAKSIIKANRALGHGAIAGHFLLLSNSIISEFHKAGAAVGVGFLDSQNSLFREINRGADFVFTNHPLRLRKILQDNLA